MKEAEKEKTEIKIMVSVCCLVYNHETFLRECFDGFVMQKTTFPIEILVHDDASTDHSADIIREYVAKYPALFKPIYQTENQYSKGVPISATYNFPRAKGKYIAMCEGDDYWTDPMKLQKQVEFLEDHLDFSLCCHNVKVWKQQEGILADDFITKDVPSETDIYELAKGNYIHTPSVIFRNDMRVLDSFLRLGYLGVGDYPLWMLCAQYGNIKKLDDCMAVYRYGSGIWANGNEYKNIIIWIKMLAKLTVVIDDEKVRMILEEQNQMNCQRIIKMYEKAKGTYFLVKFVRFIKCLINRTK